MYACISFCIFVKAVDYRSSDKITTQKRPYSKDFRKCVSFDERIVRTRKSPPLDIASPETSRMRRTEANMERVEGKRTSICLSIVS